MARINVGRMVEDTDKAGVKFQFVIPDMLKMMNININVGDEIIIPVSIRDKQATFWESGGRNPKFASAIGTTIASGSDQLLDAVLFNKLNKTPNGKQALIALKPGYHLYVGKIKERVNALAPEIKIIKLSFDGIDQIDSDEKTKYGRFVVDETMFDYGQIKDCFPAARLLDKLFSKNVSKPFFANGWSISNIAKIKERDRLKDSYVKLMQTTPPISVIHDPNQFLDAVENKIIELDNKKLSAVFQCIDFEAGIISIKPLQEIELSNIVDTVDKSVVVSEFVIPIINMISCYNTNLLLNSVDLPMLEKALEYDDKFTIYTKPRTWCCIRGYRG